MASSRDPSEDARLILFALVDGVVSLADDRDIWTTTGGLVDAATKAKSTATATMNPRTVLDAAVSFQSEVMSRLNRTEKAAKIAQIVAEGVKRIDLGILEKSMPVPPSIIHFVPALTPTPADFVRIRSEIRAIRFDPDKLDNERDKIALAAWIGKDSILHQRRVDDAVRPSQLIRIIAQLLGLIKNSKSEAAMIAKTYLIRAHKELEPLVKILGGGHKRSSTRKQRNKKRLHTRKH